MRIHPDDKAFIINNDWPGLTLSALLFIAGSYVVLQIGDIWMGAGIWALAGAITLAIIAHAHLHSSTTWIEFQEDKVVYQTGIFTHYKKMIPVGQITDTSTYASVFDRILGAGALRISTAGRPGYEIDARHFKREEVDSVHHEIYELIKKHNAHKNADAPQSPAQGKEAAGGLKAPAGGNAAPANPFASHHAHEKKDLKK